MKGTIKVKINGLNSGRIINELIDNNILLRNVMERAKYVTFEMFESDEENLKRICKKFRKNYKLISKNNLVNLIKNTKYYFGFCVAIVLFAALIFSFNFSIYKINIKVDSNNDFDISEIEKVLSEKGVGVGSRKTEINTKELERLIIQTQENVSGCTIRQNGGVLDIMIYPGVLNEGLNRENVYSKYNAVISDVQIYAGTTNLKIGDIVQKGDLLIENNNGAAGKIMAKIYFSDFLIYNENQLVRKKTGRKINKTNVMIFNKILAKKAENIAFSNYLEENCVFCVSKNCFLPISIVTTIYQEFEYENVVVRFEEMEDRLKESLLDDVKSKNNCQNITNITYSVVKENNLTRLDCFVECEIDLMK